MIWYLVLYYLVIETLKVEYILIQKLTTYVPFAEANNLRVKLFEAGAGSIGNYENCSFNVEGLGSFQGNEASNPTIGKKGETHFEEEVQLGITFARHLEHKVIKTLHENHPYEEIAYEIITLENLNQNLGLGMVGTLENEMKYFSLNK